jgi:hypothetical protein
MRMAMVRYVKVMELPQHRSLSAVVEHASVPYDNDLSRAIAEVVIE